MAEHRWSILCHRAAVDRYTNLLSILEVTDEITLQMVDEVAEPAADAASVGVVVNLELVSMFARSHRDQPETFTLTYAIETPDGDQLPLLQEPLRASLEDHQRTRQIARFQAMPFRGPGTYRLVIQMADASAAEARVVARVPLELRISSSTAR